MLLSLHCSSVKQGIAVCGTAWLNAGELGLKCPWQGNLVTVRQMSTDGGGDFAVLR